MRIRPLLLTLLLVGSMSLADESGEERLVRSYLDAYNAHDLDGMLRHMTDDVRWMMVSGDDIEVISKGKGRLTTAMTAFFTAMPSGRSEAVTMQTVGRFVSVIEQAIWETPDGGGTQCALSVYEISDDLIVNVWYYSEQPCPAETP